jgi:glutaredoxin
MPIVASAALNQRRTMPNVTLYSTSGCPLCARYRDLLNRQGRAFDERNTTENPGYLDDLAAKNIFVVPTVLVGDRAVAGFRPSSLLELL